MTPEKIELNTLQIASLKEESEKAISEATPKSSKGSASEKAAWRKFKAESGLETWRQIEDPPLFLNEKTEKILNEVYTKLLVVGYSDPVNLEDLKEPLERTDALFDKEFDYSGKNWIYKAQAYNTRMMLRQMMGAEQPIEEYLDFTELLLANIDLFDRFSSSIYQDVCRVCMRSPSDTHLKNYTLENQSFLEFNRALAFMVKGEQDKGIDALQASQLCNNRTAIMAHLMLRLLDIEPKASESTCPFYESDQRFWQGAYQEYLESSSWGFEIEDPIKIYDETYAMRGISFAMLGDYSMALKEYEKAIESYKKFGGYPDPIAYEHEICLAMLQSMSGDLDGAIERLKHLQEEPTNWPVNGSEWPVWKMTAELLEHVMRARKN